jgi:hypothetical protein
MQNDTDANTAKRGRKVWKVKKTKGVEECSVLETLSLVYTHRLPVPYTNKRGGLRSTSVATYVPEGKEEGENAIGRKAD